MGYQIYTENTILEANTTTGYAQIFDHQPPQWSIHWCHLLNIWKRCSIWRVLQFGEWNRQTISSPPNSPSRSHALGAALPDAGMTLNKIGFWHIKSLLYPNLFGATFLPLEVSLIPTGGSFRPSGEASLPIGDSLWSIGWGFNQLAKAFTWLAETSPATCEDYHLIGDFKN